MGNFHNSVNNGSSIQTGSPLGMKQLQNSLGVDKTHNPLWRGGTISRCVRSLHALFIITYSFQMASLYIFLANDGAYFGLGKVYWTASLVHFLCCDGSQRYVQFREGRWVRPRGAPRRWESGLTGRWRRLPVPSHCALASRTSVFLYWQPWDSLPTVGTNGWNTVSVKSDTRLIFATCVRIGISFYVMKVGGLRFYLVYNTPW